MNPMDTVFSLSQLRSIPLLFVLGLCLSLYFSYHSLAGQRSVGRLMDLRADLAHVESQLLHQRAARQAALAHVKMLRMETVSPDFIREQAAYNLGWRADGSVTIVLAPAETLED